MSIFEGVNIAYIPASWSLSLEIASKSEIESNFYSIVKHFENKKFFFGVISLIIH